MNTQPRNKILIIVIGILLAANVVLLMLFILNKPEKKFERKSQMSAYLKNDIGFTDQQMRKFDSVKAKHWREVKLLFDNIKASKDSSFRSIGQNGFSDSAIQKAANYSASRQQTLELLMLQHLKDIRNICTPVQQQKFDTGFYKVMSRAKPDDKGRNEK